MSTKSAQITKFGMVLGIYFSLKILIGLNPTMKGIFALTGMLMLGVFWYYLTIKQNMTLGIIRILINLSQYNKLVPVIGIFRASLFAIFMYFIGPYVIYRLAKWRKIYNQIPYGEIF